MVKTRPPARVLAMEQEIRALQALVAQFHHHLKVLQLLNEENMVEYAAWMLRGEQLLWQAEEVLPALK